MNDSQVHFILGFLKARLYHSKLKFIASHCRITSSLHIFTQSNFIHQTHIPAGQGPASEKLKEPGGQMVEFSGWSSGVPIYAPLRQ